MSKSDKKPIEEQLQNLVEKFEGENKALRKILLNLTQSKDQSQTPSESEKDSTTRQSKKGEDKQKRDNQ